MNWARDDADLSIADLETVFKYDPQECTVVRMLSSQGWKVEISSHKDEKDWNQFIEHELPAIDGKVSGLVVLLAKRSGEPCLSGIQKTSYDDWIQRANTESNLVSGGTKTNTYSALLETEMPASKSKKTPIPSGRRDVRTVPFSRETFEKITSNFHIHDSIARVVSRTDVPVFTCAKVTMIESTYVYNCRSSNAWEMDLALTVTHFPKSGLTFAILFGCPFSIEKEIIMRLAKLKAEVAHPLLMPGMFAEIEQRRHTNLVEEMGNELETLIFQLDHQVNDFEGSQGALAETRSKDKRTAYLDLSYLRNSLVSWNTQLAKMVQHCQQLNKEQYNSKSVDNSVLHQNNDLRVRRTLDQVASRSSNVARSPSPDEWCRVEASKESNSLIRKDPWTISRSSEEWEDRQKKLQDTGCKIESRLMSIRDEYDEKIRDCTMRVDGMAMSTQWSHSETNVQIALATNRDSRHMRSIALVTMIFLPGTFFASMFSMTFFNWSNNPDSPTVSMYLWIYVLITVFFTSLTVGLWYYIVVLRPSKRKIKDDEQG